jgi:hypothetical protein
LYQWFLFQDFFDIATDSFQRSFNYGNNRLI